MGSTSGRTARFNGLISQMNKDKLLAQKGNMSEAAYVDWILTYHFNSVKDPRASHVRKAAKPR